MRRRLVRSARCELYPVRCQQLPARAEQVVVHPLPGPVCDMSCIRLPQFLDVQANAQSPIGSTSFAACQCSLGFTASGTTCVCEYLACSGPRLVNSG